MTSSTAHYVDVRIEKETRGGDLETPYRGGLSTNIEWAFAGISHATEGSNQNGIQGPGHSVWEHWIDSKSDDPPSDEGDMWLQANGDVLERGKDVDPDTGKIKEYEELWRDLKIDLVDQEIEHISTVLKAENVKTSAKGMVIRIGGWCQGILKVGNDLTIERWCWTKLESEQVQKLSSTQTSMIQQETISGKWEKLWKLGNGSLPCAATFKVTTLKENTTIQAGDLEWKVIENYRW